ncbi:sigma-70 family RNA polymerase sigma factor [Luteolibacter ambystomatis]|uniref:Sigma-70 family RNA polymerase sigma factor n=1 Tax=Luteolibacter ambystomatis TaxID=2824561 RepID=A0A975J2E0_9BACT|nr:sigma-70 family RNA polymerase sigma factor [Luteolibacter ambystomatis]QUE52783.1 sigma-70 family RNA polymerase sigma factor [Luteolibacter ambystomatis]
MSEAVPMESGNWLAEILVRYEKPLLKHAYTLCSDRELARDAVQETFFRLIRHREKGMPENLAAWLFTVCRNVVSDHLRRQKVVTFGLDPARFDIPDDDGMSPDAQLDRGERERKLAELVAELPDRERELVRLKFQVGLSYREIEEVTGISQGNVGYFLHLAVKQLRQRWRVEGGDA